MKVNLNDFVTFTPTRAGARIWNADDGRPWASPGVALRYHLRDFCEAFGDYVPNGNIQVVKDNDIYIEGDSDA